MMEVELPGEVVRTFILAGKANFTIRSRETGTRYTYRVVKSDDAYPMPTVYFVSVLTGPANESDYRYIGFIRNGNFFHGGAKARINRDAQSVVAFGWFWKHIESPQVEVTHSGRCGRCGRLLTVPESVHTGFGPECATLVGVDLGSRVAPPVAPVISETSETNETDRPTLPAPGYAGPTLPPPSIEDVERTMQLIKAAGDRAQTIREETLKAAARAEMER